MYVTRLAFLCSFILAVNSLAIRNKRNMFPERRWPKNPSTGLVNIPWTMDCSKAAASGCKSSKTAASKAAETLAKNTCIRLQYTSNPPTDYIAVERDEGNVVCGSIIGNAGGRQPLHLDPECDDENIAIHEFMHALGFDHEQNRPDRDNYVTINWENIEPMREIYFMKAVDSKTLGLPYDYYSIMHYYRDEYSNGGGDTIRTNDPSKQHVVIGQNGRGPTQLDYDKINKLYECKEGKTPKPDSADAADASKPDSGETSKPDSGETSTPDSGETSKPDSGETSKPDSGETSKPDSGETSKPDSGETSTPDSGETSKPDSGETSKPDSGETSKPDSGETSKPDSGETSKPDSGETSKPDSGETSKPDSGETSKPDSGETPKPDSAETANKSMKKCKKDYDNCRSTKNCAKSLKLSMMDYNKCSNVRCNEDASKNCNAKRKHCRQKNCEKWGTKCLNDYKNCQANIE